MDGWPDVFRQHRHDVLNGLQLVQGYLQLGKPDRALAALIELSGWLQGVSRAQSVAADSDWEFVFAVATCASLELAACERLFPMDEPLLRELSHLWRALQQSLASSSVPRLRVQVYGTAEPGVPSRSADVVLMGDPDVDRWWLGVADELGRGLTRVNIRIRRDGCHPY
ncbi:Spo0B domain-containing protein [Alicyclobacillus kakegawensis]|uniref:Spo0B domain-containing protein n=1 Tax=Alicyclobacillus kakegawensis TaxID=392012 RepID=UPI00082BB98E|nr:Spo0B domain-containing protein [Alicyclobacillus kakegawensis]